MIQNPLVRILLSPIALLYGIGVSIRNVLYDAKILRATSFSIPVISVGNLSIGGAGKTPHIEYLVRLLGPYIHVATLSRGYKRKTQGFRFVRPAANVLDVGDEPLQFARKFPDIVVAVSESRTIGIPMIVKHHPEVQTILLDDAFQHRSVRPYINILLTQHEMPFTEDYLLPAGRLREWRSAYDRAEIIIVTKCPEDLTKDQAEALRKSLKPYAHQQVFFSKYRYGNPYSFYFPDRQVVLQPGLDILLISAIANTQYLEQYLTKFSPQLTKLEYEDHHVFTEQDISEMISTFQRRSGQSKCIITTEKDAMRLDLHKKKLYELQIPIFILPIHVEFLFDQQAAFDELIKGRLLQFSA